MTYDISKLFQPATVGKLKLANRGVLAPLTRYRADRETAVPSEMAVEYYTQRAQRPGTLLISEATSISRAASGEAGIPGIWSEEQMQGWKKITDAVHEKGSFMYLQMWAHGRAANPEFLMKYGLPYVSSGDRPLPNSDVKPHSLNKDEIKEYIETYKQAAINSINAGFDGVEIHSANGYLLNQFLSEESNNRADEYGGPIENRARIVLEVVDAVVAAIGADRVGIRLSPWSSFGGMKHDGSPIPVYSYLVNELEKRGSKGDRLAYIHMVEPRIDGNKTNDGPVLTKGNQFVRQIWNGTLIHCGRMAADLELLSRTLEDDSALAAFGRFYISNPDLISRLEHGKELTKYNRGTFYLPGPEGYVDYKNAP